MPETLRTLATADIVFDKAFYPRTESQSPAKVQEYATSIAGGSFPPILITHDYRILDGWHRWKAHEHCGLTTIDALVLDTTGMDMHTIRRKAACQNVRHGLPQTEAELKKLIRDEYKAKLDALTQVEREDLKKEMAADYSRSLDYIRGATSRIDKDYKAELRETAFQLWLGCATQKQIAEDVGYSQPVVSAFLDSIKYIGNGTEPVSDKSAEKAPGIMDSALRTFEGDDEEEDSNSLGVYTLDHRLLLKAQHLDEHFKPPLYNIWKQQERTAGISHFGNSEVAWLDNLLYLYTKPFDIVIDPFAGSGSTIDLCKARLRRYLVSDRQPIDIRSDIRTHDVTTGPLAPPTWQQVGLVYLDPPYWKQAAGKYSAAASDLANMTLDDFTDSLSALIKGYADRLRRAQNTTAVIALLLQPTQWNAPEHAYTDHVADLLRRVKLPLLMRISCPYESQQCTAQMVEYAKAHKMLLVLTRELVLWRVP